MYLITLASDIESFPRLSKLFDAFEDLDMYVEHWVWVRRRDQIDSYRGYEYKNVKRKIILVGGGYSNKKLAPYYIVFAIKIFIEALKTNGASFYCLGFISALPIFISSYLNRGKYLFDNNDNISKSYRWPGNIKRILQKLEFLIVRRASIHMVPSRHRWPYNDTNLRISPNVPSRKIFNEAKQVIFDNPYVKKQGLTLYVNGLLTQGRGIEIILKVAEKLQDKVRIILAGKLVSEQSERLSKLSNVKYLGELSSAESLSYYFRSDLVLTMYDPSVEINRLAEPNKWGDCMATGTPFFVNSEVETAKPYIEEGLCFHAPYSDVDQICRLIESLIENPSRLDKARENMEKYNSRYWEDYISSILREFVL